MDRLSLDAPTITRAGVIRPPHLVSRIALSISLVLFAVVFGLDWYDPPSEAGWTGQLLFVLLAVSTLCSLARDLPWQNVLSVAVIIPSLAAALEVAGIPTAVRFGLANGTRTFEPFFSIHQAGLATLVWIVAILNCRGVARLLMRRWRTVPGYGFWLLGITIVLVVRLIPNLGRLLSLARLHSEALAPLPQDWHGVGIFAGTACVSAVVLMAITPALINKKPVTELLNWHPLVLWILLNLCSLSKTVEQGSSVAAGIILLELLLVIIFTARRMAPTTDNSMAVNLSPQDGTRPTI